MLPLLPFAIGLATGVIAVKLFKSDKARASLDKAQERVREATVSGLNAIEHSSAMLREKLEPAANMERAPENAPKTEPASAADESKASPGEES